VAIRVVDEFEPVEVDQCDRAGRAAAAGAGDLLIELTPESTTIKGSLKVKSGTNIKIAGKPDKQTPIFSDEMEEIVFNPYWNVPNSIKIQEIAPYLQQGGGFRCLRHRLSRQHAMVVDETIERCARHRPGIALVLNELVNDGMP